MSSLSEHIGGRIRMYRRNKNFSLDQIATMINKSKSTVSKYEQGSVRVDLETLFEIANALDVSVHQLVDYTMPSASGHDGNKRNRLFGSDHFYFYFLDGRKKGLYRGYAEVNSDSLNDDTIIMYFDIESFSHFSKCRFLYYGKIHNFDLMTRIDAENQASPIEHVTIYALPSLSHEDFVIGHLCGISTQPFVPFSTRCILSGVPLKEDEALNDKLRLSTDDLRAIKKLNMYFATSTYYI